jgi:hypothetical protein
MNKLGAYYWNIDSHSRSFRRTVGMSISIYSLFSQNDSEIIAYGGFCMTHGREFDKKGLYHIYIHREYDIDWGKWFEGFQVSCGNEGEIILRGYVADQSDLHGILARIRALNMTLIEVERVPDQENFSSADSKIDHGGEE